MQLSLFQATLVFGLFLFVAGGVLLLRYPSASSLARAFPRSRRAGTVLMVLALAWTLFRVTKLGAADYGDFKQYILIGFLLLGGAAFRYAPDFLSVRACCILYLLAADHLLDAAWMHYDQPLRLLLVTPVYAGIALALYLAYAPYRLRDFFGWLFQASSRGKGFAVAMAAYGLLLGGVAFSF